ncbi:MAG: RNA-directed DNA polymerase [Prevotella sp.]|nr:RNA-directed DNA polymerase [Prevotella sp.]
MDEQLTYKLFAAYYDARKHKRNTLNQLRFELDYERNLLQLAEELAAGTYKMGRAVCFVIDEPVKREIIAADFRDRVIHHLLFNCFNPVFEQQFIADSYSCRKDKGTLYGVRRMEKFMKQCSAGYTCDCYVLKLDVSGYFMHINRALLWDKLMKMIAPFAETHHALPLLKQVVFNNPLENCIFRSPKSAWDGLPVDKSMFRAAAGCGLPIGNLTSQLFSNVYLHDFDLFVKNELKMEYYGQYVDDFVLMHESREALLAAKTKIAAYLNENCRLTLHPRKIYLQHYSKGFAFLGAYVKPGRTYAGKRIKSNFKRAAAQCEKELSAGGNPSKVRSTLNSYLGLMKHFDTYNLKKKTLWESGNLHCLYEHGYFTNHFWKYKLNK